MVGHEQQRGANVAAQIIRVAFAFVVVVALVVAFSRIQRSIAGGSAGSVSALDPSDPRPTPQPGSPTPLGYASVTGTGGEFAFLDEGPDGRPVSYDPCREIHVVVNDRRAPPDAAVLLDAALRSISSASGFRFVLDGMTDEPPSLDRPAFQPERYGDRWAPVLIAWSDQVESPDLGEHAVGYARSVPIVVDDHAVYVTGDVTLDGPVTLAHTQFGGGADLQAILMHELGHVLGLDHVPSTLQLMYEDNDGQRGLGGGDRAGLAELGRSPCIPML